MSDLYEILGADPDDTPEALRRHYLATIGEVHPDRAESDEEAQERTRLTATVTAAWAVLGDRVAREAYDRSRGRRRLPRLLRSLRSSLGRRRWISGRPHPRIEIAPLRSALGALGALLYETRLGQWSLVALVALVAGGLGGEIAAAAAAAAVGLLLAGAGEPTPIADARSIAAMLATLPARLLVALLRSAGGWLSPRLSEARERERGFEAGVTSHLERSKRALAREGERPKPPPARISRPEWRGRRPRPPRRSGQPRSRRP